MTPDYAQIMNRVTIRAKTVKEATDANSKVMAAITAALLEIRVAQKDIQTLQFFSPAGLCVTGQEPRREPKLSGYSVSDQVSVKRRRIGKVAEILDRLVTEWISEDSRFAPPVPMRAQASSAPTAAPVPLLLGHAWLLRKGLEKACADFLANAVRRR